MKVFDTADAIRNWSNQQHAAGHTVGFVPTMGFLHQGHLSLMDLARKETDQFAVSIFVNPTQFGPGEDFEQYPRDTDRDLELCEARAVDAVWLPSVDEMYPEGFSTYVDVQGLGEHLCGASRPGHFRGVTTVVSKLFNVVRPDVAVFGRKDAQQARILQRMTEDLQFGIRIVLGDTARENDGLAMSSRNVRLSPEHREQAPSLNRALTTAAQAFRKGETDAARLIGLVREQVNNKARDGIVDYIQLVDWSTLQPVDKVESPSLLALAVKFGEVRLIDNIMLETKTGAS